MPLPLLIGAAAIVAGITGVGAGVHGGMKMSKANDKLKNAQELNKANVERLEEMNKRACQEMDNLGKNEMEILSGFKHFSDLFEKIKNRPEFGDIRIGEVHIPKFKQKELEEAYVGANILLGGLTGATLGTAGGFAASGATTAAVMALGTASTGTAISSLTGVAATNATLAALGGGSLATGGGGMALGSTILGGATLGVGLLVGGVIFSVTGSILSNKADKAWKQMKENEGKINIIYFFLSELKRTAKKYNQTLLKVRKVYETQLNKMAVLINKYEVGGNVNWNNLSKNEKLIIENTVMLVGVLYNMCKVQLVEQSKVNDNLNKMNVKEITEAENNAKKVLDSMNVAV